MTRRRASQSIRPIIKQERFLTGIGTQKREKQESFHSTTSGSHTLRGGLRDKALHCLTWYPLVYFGTRRGSRDSVTRSVTAIERQFCTYFVRIHEKGTIVSDRSVASLHVLDGGLRHIHKLCFLPYSRSIFLRSVINHEFSQRGVSKIWHISRLIHVHMYHSVA